MSEQTKQKIQSLIREYIKDVPDSSSLQVRGAYDSTGAGKLKAKPKAPAKPKADRKPSAWNGFLKCHIDKHRGADGKLSKPFAELSKEASALYAKGAGVASAPRQPELDIAKFVKPRADDVNFVGAEVEVSDKAPADASAMDDLEGGFSLQSILEAFKGVRMNFRPASRKVLEKYGSKAIESIKVCRKPLDLALQKVTKLVARKTIPFDKLFHLSIRFKLVDGPTVRVDKTEVLHVVVGDDTVDTECIAVNMKGKKLTIDQVLATTKKAIGDDKFFRYRATTQNCQRFVLDILESNGLSTPELKKFILQDVKGLFADPISKIADIGTDLKSRLDVAIEGKGAGRKRPNLTALAESTPNTQKVGIPDLEDNIFTEHKTEEVRKDLIQDYQDRAAPVAATVSAGAKPRAKRASKPKASPKAQGPRKKSTYSVALKMWNDLRVEQGHKYMIPRKGTSEYEELQDVKSLIEEAIRD